MRGIRQERKMTTMTRRQPTNTAATALTKVPSQGSVLTLAGVLNLLLQRGRRLGRARWIGAGATLAAVGIFLFSTRKGRALRAGWGRRAGALLGSQLGEVIGAQVGAHPVQAARLAARLARR
jgi:hypothetical protein